MCLTSEAHRNRCSRNSWQDLEPLISFYERPYLSHEVGILDTYILWIWKSAMREPVSVLHSSPAHAHCCRRPGSWSPLLCIIGTACYWSAVLRKLDIELLRLTRGVSGYDYLGAIDCHWHRCGYTPGILNEFHEYKPGEDAAQILRYNGESLVLADLGEHRNYRCDEEITFSVFSSLYGSHTEGPATLEVRLTGSRQRLFGSASYDISRVPLYDRALLQQITLTAPTLSQPEPCCLSLRLIGPDYMLENQYSLWLFPDVQPDWQDIRAFHHADPDLLPFLQSGGRALILSPLNMSWQPLHFRKLNAGRTLGTTAPSCMIIRSGKDFPRKDGVIFSSIL